MYEYNECIIIYISYYNIASKLIGIEQVKVLGSTPSQSYPIFDAYNSIIIINIIVTNIMQYDAVQRLSSFLSQKTPISEKLICNVN